MLDRNIREIEQIDSKSIRKDENDDDRRIKELKEDYQSLKMNDG